MKKIYLSGPMDSCTEEQMFGWRNNLKADLKGEYEFLDPTDRPLGVLSEKKPCIDLAKANEIVKVDKDNIDAADIVFVYVWKPSHGTSMEIIYAWEQGKTVIAVAPNILSPWVQGHSHFVFRSIRDAVCQLKIGVPVQKKFCLGFMFHGDYVVLTRKQRPDWQRGLLNGVGGKVELGELPVDSMVREFREETGYPTHRDEWKQFATMRTRWQTSSQRSYVIDLFTAKARPGAKFVAQTDEQVTTLPWRDLHGYSMVHNNPWLINMALTTLLRANTPVYHLYYEDVL